MTDSFEKGVDFSACPAEGSGLRVAIVRSRWNAVVVDALVQGCVASLMDCHVAQSDIRVVEVAGSFELPFTAKLLSESGDIDAVICVGVLIKGATMHFEYISESVARGIMELNTRAGNEVPVIFGVLTCLTEDQALERAGIKGDKCHNHGKDWGYTAVQQAKLAKTIRKK